MHPVPFQLSVPNFPDRPDSPPDKASSSRSLAASAARKRDWPPALQSPFDVGYKACETLSCVFEVGDRGLFEGVRRSARLQDSVAQVLDSPQGRLVEGRYPGAREELWGWLVSDVQETPSVNARDAVDRLKDLFTVQERGELRHKTPREMSAEAVLLRWAAAPHRHASSRQALVWQLMELHHHVPAPCGGLGLQGGVRWDRLHRAGLLSCIDGLTHRGLAMSTRNSERLNQRLTAVIDAVTANDVAAHSCGVLISPVATGLRSDPLRTLEAVERLVAFEVGLPAYELQPPEGDVAFARALATVKVTETGLPAGMCPPPCWSDAWAALHAQPTQAGLRIDMEALDNLKTVLAAAMTMPLTRVTGRLASEARACLDKRSAPLSRVALLTEGDVRLVKVALYRSIRYAFDRVSTDSHLLGFRGLHESQALKLLKRWAGTALDVEGARRERWIELILNRAVQPYLRPTVDAALLLTGESLPPWSAVRGMGLNEGLSDPAPSTGGDAAGRLRDASNLLQCLGVRQLRMTMAEALACEPHGMLSLDCIRVVVLRTTEWPTREQLAHALERLTSAMRALHSVRLQDGFGPFWVDGETIPAGWMADPDNVGDIRHERREALREVLAPMKPMWPQAQIPERVRASAMNLRDGGEEVLEFLRQLHAQRSQWRPYFADDPEMVALVEPVLDGMSTDAAYARRCRGLVGNLEGPCADAGMRTLAAMARLWQVVEARDPLELAENAFAQACLSRADAIRAEQRPRFRENLEDAMVLQWFASSALQDMLGTDRIRVSPRPVFGHLADLNWDAPDRAAGLREQAVELIRAEAHSDFPGVTELVQQEGPMGDVFRQRLDSEELAALKRERQRLRDAFNAAFDAGRRGVEQLQALDAIDADIRHYYRRALDPHLAAIKARVLAPQAQGADLESPSKRARRSPPTGGTDAQ